MLQYWPIIKQEAIGKKDLEQLTELDLSELEKCIGQYITSLIIPFMKASFLWPFWTGIKMYGSWISFVLNVLIFIATFFYVARMINNNKLDITLATEVCVQILVQCFTIFGTYFTIFDKENFALLIIMMKRNLLQCNSEERKFLQYYINIANFASYIITGLLCCSYNMYCIIIPVLWPVTANFILPGNNTHAKKLSIHFELFNDEETHFYYYFIIVVILCYNAQVFISSLGIMYIFSAAFLVAKFRFMGFKLKEILILSESEDILGEKNEIHKHITDLVQLHQYCIYYFDVLNSITSPISIFGTLNVIIVFSLSVYVMVVEYKRDINLALKMFFAYILCSEYLFVSSHPSQMILDASGDIFDDCYSTDWYKYPIKTRKMIQLIMIRSSRPSCIKIGPSKCSNYETSRQLVQLSLSYFVSLMSIYGH